MSCYRKERKPKDLSVRWNVEVCKEMILLVRKTLFALLVIAIPSVGIADCIYLKCDRLSGLKTKPDRKTKYPEVPLVQITTRGSCAKPFASRTNGKETGIFTFSPSYQQGVREHDLIVTPNTYHVQNFIPAIARFAEVNRKDLSAYFYDSKYQCRVISHGEAWDIHQSFSIDQKI